ncbi:hydrolase Nlp/P60 [Sphingobacterium griseoflavum]|uniref:Hydrolase Nlp/P60 n=2 Tax=Sphingobacterium griseoflavum TaxID=1474952 RepID=A0ABQ3HY37_9SPHI|nr:hydrolase Nlp/P60 [Sphingobacterium griseoflavum]
MVNQLLFAEYFEILEELSDWVYIRMLASGYEGWLQVGQFNLCTDTFHPQECGGYQVVGRAGAQAVSGEKIVKLVPGTTFSSSFFSKDQPADAWDYQISGALRSASLSDFQSEFPELVRFYNFSPYLWGGRSPYGIDCSGLTQALFVQFGIRLPRDAYQQAEKGTTVDFATEIRTGDLAFFDDEEGRITHVGVMLDVDRIFHASASVRIDQMDAQGIFRRDWNRYTHKLRIIKRLF